MHSFTVLYATLLFAGSALAAFTVNSPATLEECVPTLIVWSGAAGSENDTLYLSVIPGGDVSGAALETFSGLKGNSGNYTWATNLPAGTNVTIKAVDVQGNNAYTAPVLIQPGTDCPLATTGATVAGTGATAAAAAPASPTAGSGNSTSNTTSNSSSSTPVIIGGPPGASNSSSSSSSSDSNGNNANSPTPSPTPDSGSTTSSTTGSSTSPTTNGSPPSSNRAAAVVVLFAAGIAAAVLAA